MTQVANRLLPKWPYAGCTWVENGRFRFGRTHPTFDLCVQIPVLQKPVSRPTSVKRKKKVLSQIVAPELPVNLIPNTYSKDIFLKFEF